MYTMKIHVHAILAIFPLKKFEDVFLKLRMVVIFNNEKLTTEKRFLYIPSTSIFHGQHISTVSLSWSVIYHTTFLSKHMRLRIAFNLTTMFP